MTHLEIRDNASLPMGFATCEVVEAAEFRRWVANGSILRRFREYRQVVLVTPQIDQMRRPFVTQAAMRWITSGMCEVRQPDGRIATVTSRRLAVSAVGFARDLVLIPALRRRTARDVEWLERQAGDRHQPRSGLIVYMRSDLDLGLVSGGSVGHTAGVLNSLGSTDNGVVFITPDLLPLVEPSIETIIVKAEPRFWDFSELPEVAFSRTLFQGAGRALGARDVAMVYQRYSTYDYAGVALARRYKVPFVLEYNGSAIWISRNWGRRLRDERLAERIELLNLRSADLVVVVSQAMQDELVARGIPAAQILVNPNGVDPHMYRPDVDGGSVRERYGLDGSTVIGFIGTFQPWHGAEVLANAFGILADQRPDLVRSSRLLMIGDGPGLPAVRQILEAHGVLDAAVFTGRTRQEEGPALLAGCEILVSPHVPNQDGSPFFGSPTKLFEYMAMGKAIVASDLEQIGDVLRDDETALLVPPGDPQSLAMGIARLTDDDALRARLGAAARARVLESFTWDAHTRRILDAVALKHA
jgi:glycosyltransferase involved in cell wall biosynthesis